MGKDIQSRRDFLRNAVMLAGAGVTAPLWAAMKYDRNAAMRYFREQASETDARVKAGIEANRMGDATLVFRDAQGRPCERVTLKVAEMKMGAQRVVAELFDGKERLGGAETTFTRVERMPKMSTCFDRQGRAIVDGKPFFLLGMYWSAVTTNKIETYAKGPFNCLMPYHAPNSKDLMDLCHAKGLKVIYSVKDIYSGTRWAPKGIKTEADETRYIKDRVNRFKDHPALLAWYLNDELPLTMLPRLAARRTGSISSTTSSPTRRNANCS